MNPRRLAVLAAALVVAILGALLARATLFGHETPKAAPLVAPVAPPPPPMAQVLVARRDLQPGDRIVAGDLGWQAWPKSSLNPAFVVQPEVPAAAAGAPTGAKLASAAAKGYQAAKNALTPADDGPAAQFVDGVVREALLSGEPVIPSKIVRAGSSGVLAVTLSPGMRAVAVPLSPETSAGGFILPGDHVDVVQSVPVDSQGAARRFEARTVLRNVKVLAIDQNLKASKGGATALGATATLEASPEQMEVLVMAKAAGALTLVLRSYADAAGPTEVGDGRGAQAPIVRVFRHGAPTDVVVNQ